MLDAGLAAGPMQADGVSYRLVVDYGDVVWGRLGLLL